MEIVTKKVSSRPAGQDGRLNRGQRAEDRVSDEHWETETGNGEQSEAIAEKESRAHESHVSERQEKPQFVGLDPVSGHESPELANDDDVCNGDDDDETVEDDGAAEITATEQSAVSHSRSSRVRNKPKRFDNYLVGQQTVNKFLDFQVQDSRLMEQVFKSI